MNMELKNSTAHLKELKEIYKSRMNQAGDRTSGCENKIKALDQIHRNIKKTEKENMGTVQHHEKSQTLRHRWGKRIPNQVHSIVQIFSKIMKERRERSDMMIQKF